MSDWEGYLDTQTPELFDPSPLILGYPGPLIIADKFGFLLNGVEPYIKSNLACAREFLDLVKSGRIQFGQQQRVVRLLCDVHQAIHGYRSQLASLEELLNQTLEVLGANIDSFMRAQDTPLELRNEDLGMYYGYGGYAGAIRYGLSVARNVALTAFIKSFCERFSGNKQPSDFCGEWKLLVTDPTDAEYAKSFEGVYGLSAETSIVKYRREKTWSVQFLHFPPFISWYSLEGKAYKAAAPIVAELLQATVEADGQLTD